MKLVFATHNLHKFDEVKKLVPSHITLLSLADLGLIEEIPETGDTLEANARLKADYVTERYGLPCFSDDTGLLVNALNGAPGVYSARYAGEQKNAGQNMDKLLAELKDKKDRSARFVTIIALNLAASSHIFEGRVEGEIIHERQGEGGFGYDPIFRPNGYERTFAELPMEAKNQISHRGRAVQELINFLKKFR